MSGIVKPIKNIFGQQRYAERQGPYEGRTSELTDLLMARAKGERPGPAQEMTRQALEDNLQNTISSIRSAPGVTPALRARMIARAGERAGTEIVRKGQLGMLEEQLGTERGLASLLSTSRGQDISGFHKEQDRRNFLRDFASGAGQAIGVGATGGAGKKPV